MLKLQSITSHVLTASSTAISQEKHRRTSRKCLDDLAGLTRVIAIDPGLQGTGVAEFIDEQIVGASVIQVESRFSSLHWADRADLVTSSVASLVFNTGQIKGHIPGNALYDTIVICEMPEFQGGSQRSMGWKTGDLQRLAYLVGLFSGRVHPVKFYPVGVREWKGQLPKHLVEQRLTRTLGSKTCKTLGIKTHAWDAVGIGMWSLGKF